MPKGYELEGQKFNCLTVINRVENPKRKERKWKCKCTCGGTTSVVTYDLTSGHTKSCGCVHGLTPKKYIKSKTKTDDNGCWIWIASSRRRGYGIVSLNKKQWIASRLSYSLFKGEIPEGMFVCHHCDNPRCINPDHLFLGTAKDNGVDMANKGRSAKGEKNGNVSITAKEASDIKKMLAEGLSGEKISEKTGISIHIVYHIKTGKTWKHL